MSEISPTRYENPHPHRYRNALFAGGLLVGSTVAALQIGFNFEHVTKHLQNIEAEGLTIVGAGVLGGLGGVAIDRRENSHYNRR